VELTRGAGGTGAEYKKRAAEELAALAKRQRRQEGAEKAPAGKSAPPQPTGQFPHPCLAEGRRELTWGGWAGTPPASPSSTPTPSAKAQRRKRREEKRERRLAEERAAEEEERRQRLLKERRKRHRRYLKSLPEGSADVVERRVKALLKGTRRAWRAPTSGTGYRPGAITPRPSVKRALQAARRSLLPLGTPNEGDTDSE
jgi:hypothetical protein